MSPELTRSLAELTVFEVALLGEMSEVRPCESVGKDPSSGTGGGGGA